MIDYIDLELNAAMINNNIDGIKKHYTELTKLLRDCRNELCARCYEDKQRYIISCEGCRWRDV